VIGTTQNTGSLKTSGIDVGASWDVDTGVGGIALAFQGTWLDELRNEPLPGLGSYDCKGLFGPTCGQPTPEWRHQARISYTDPDKIGTISLNWRYIGGTRLTNNTDDPFLKSDVYTINAQLPAYSYFDLAGSIAVQKGLTFRFGVNNLLDKDPPAIAQGLLAVFGNGNTYPGMYDVVGRSFFFGLNAQF
jgi:iron complex outermembrane receptor protein